MTKWNFILLYSVLMGPWSLASANPVLSSSSPAVVTAATVTIQMSFESNVKNLSFPQGLTLSNAVAFGLVGSGSLYSFTLQPLTAGDFMAELNVGAATLQSGATNQRPSNLLQFDYQLNAIPVITQSVTTQAASQFCSAGTYPSQWTWATSGFEQNAVAAVGGTPKVEQYRQGKLIATYSALGGDSSENCYIDREDPYNDPQKYAAEGCGPFHHQEGGYYHLWLNGDTFLVYPAVYTGEWGQPNIGQLPGPNGMDTPSNITIRGVTIKGVRPVIQIGAGNSAANNTLGQAAVYFAAGNNIVFDNIDIDGTGAKVGIAGVYVNGINNLTISRSRIHDFQFCGMNGILGTTNNTGTVTLDQLELYYNGGDGTHHNIYMDQSFTDMNYTIHAKNIWSHDVAGGHLYKSRAQINIIEGSYIQGGAPHGNYTYSESYDVDIPNGGVLTMHNNTLTKGLNGYGGNEIYIGYAQELGSQCNPQQVCEPDGRTMSVDIRENTFVNFAKVAYQIYPNYPYAFFYPTLDPSTFVANQYINVDTNNYAPGFNIEFSAFNIAENAYVGFCPQGIPVMDYRGDLNASEGFSELNSNFSVSNKFASPDNSLLNSTAYAHIAQPGMVRLTNVIGGSD